MTRLRYNSSEEGFTGTISSPTFATCAIRWSVDRDSIRPLRSRRKSSEKLSLLVESPDREPPSNEQNAAIEFLSANPQRVFVAVLRFALAEAKRCYYSDSLPSADACEGETRQVRRQFDKVDGFRELVQPTEITILRESSQGLAYVSFDFSSVLDNEHGFSVLTHRAKALRWAGAGERGGGVPTSTRSDVDAFFAAIADFRDSLARVRNATSARKEVENIKTSRSRLHDFQKKCREETVKSSFRLRWSQEYNKCGTEMKRIIQDIPDAVLILSPALRGESNWAAFKKEFGRRG